MGCGASRFDANGVESPARLRPFFLHRLEDFALRRHSQVPLTAGSSSTHNSKKELLLHDSIEDDSASKDRPLINDAQKSMSVEASDKERLEGKNSEDQVKIELDELTDGEFEDVEEEDYDERLLRDDDFESSPSFRVYVKDDGDDDNNNGTSDSFEDADTSDSFEDAVSSKELCASNESASNKKVVKRGRKMRSFRNVLTKGGQTAVKNILNVKSCYNSSNLAHHRTHLLTQKSTARSYT
ncbi:nucleolin-like [Abeliophyllum distichum]|uniref:Nucleolin-like n=1 Tax=Abeliophyllum distichum TaxID=126358 RepID=A0ABD1RWU5_9LAMI